jgi:hypothetical protein
MDSPSQAFGPARRRSSTRPEPRHPVHPPDRPLVQLGQGVHQQRSSDDDEPHVGYIVDIASDKSLTNRLLDLAGLPFPSAVVETVDQAADAANRIGYPCVIKPLDGNHGRGVNLDLRSEEAVRKAFPLAAAESRSGDLVVESYVAGNDYRCLVIGGKVAAIAERVPASVVGDGEHTVRGLVDIANQDPRRGIGHEKVLTRIKLDEAAGNSSAPRASNSTTAAEGPVRCLAPTATCRRRHVDRPTIRPTCDSVESSRPPPDRRLKLWHRLRPALHRDPVRGPAGRSSWSTRAGTDAPRTEGRAQCVAKPVIDGLPPGSPCGSRSSRSPARTARRRPSGDRPS